MNEIEYGHDKIDVTYWINGHKLTHTLGSCSQIVEQLQLLADDKIRVSKLQIGDGDGLELSASLLSELDAQSDKVAASWLSVLVDAYMSAKVAR
jgi:hypothetical protein